MRLSTRKVVISAALCVFMGGVAALTAGCVLAMSPVIMGGVLMIMVGALGCTMSCIATSRYAT